MYWANIYWQIWTIFSSAFMTLGSERLQFSNPSSLFAFPKCCNASISQNTIFISQVFWKDGFRWSRHHLYLLLDFSRSPQTCTPPMNRIRTPLRVFPTRARFKKGCIWVQAERSSSPATRQVTSFFTAPFPISFRLRPRSSASCITTIHRPPAIM